MAELDQIIQVNITRNTTSPSQVGFGTPMLASYHTKYVDRVRTYTSLSSMEDDGFTSADPAYKMAADLLAQSPTVPNFKVGRLDNASAQTIDFTPSDTTEGLVYTIKVTGPGGAASLAGETFSYTVAASDTVALICDGLVAAMAANVGSWTVTDNATHITIAADNSGELFGFSDLNAELESKDNTPDPGLAADLGAILTADQDWYGFALDSNSEAQINAAAAWVEANERIFIAQSSDNDILVSLTTTDIASDLQTAAYDRTALFFHRGNQDYISAAFLGKALPPNPGTVTNAYKTLSSINVDSLTSSNLTVLDAKGANHYTRLAGVNITRYGIVSSGEYLDIIQGTDWLKARIQERIYGVLVNNGKVPYTTSGINLIRAEILAQLRIGVQRGFLAASPEPTCTVPAIGDVAAADKAQRLLQDVLFRATLAGAIHKVTVDGQLTL